MYIAVSVRHYNTVERRTHVCVLPSTAPRRGPQTVPAAMNTPSVDRYLRLALCSKSPIAMLESTVSPPAPRPWTQRPARKTIMEPASAQRSEPEPKRRIDSNVMPVRADAPDKSERMGCEMHMASRYEAPIQKLSVVLPRRSAVMFYSL